MSGIADRHRPPTLHTSTSAATMTPVTRPSRYLQTVLPVGVLPSKEGSVNRNDRQPAPARSAHAVTCHHRWCYCYDPASHESDPNCIHCQRAQHHRDAVALREQENQVKKADPISRHPEGM